MINYQLKKQEEIIGTFETKKDVVDEVNYPRAKDSWACKSPS